VLLKVDMTFPVAFEKDTRFDPAIAPYRVPPEIAEVVVIVFAKLIALYSVPTKAFDPKTDP
jgi:hypothetical protein